MKVLDFNGLKLVIERIKYLIIESVDNHKNDTDIHVSEDEKNKWNNISNIENQLNNLDKENAVNIASLVAKLQQLESAVYEDITGNPFTITFENIDGLDLTNGIFNENMTRLEC